MEGYVGKRNRGHALEQTAPMGMVDRLLVLILMICSAVVPLVVSLHEISLDEKTIAVYTGVDRYIDIFSFWKSSLLMACLLAMVLAWGYQFVNRHRLQKRAYFMPLAAYAVLIIASMAFSAYPSIARNGFPDRLEGGFVLLCYVMLAFTASQVLRNKTAKRAVLTCILASSVVLALLGATQYLGADFFKTELGRRILVPAAYQEYRDKLTFNFGANNMYTTVYNPNYLGSYSALLLPVSLMYLYSSLQGKRWKIALGYVFIAASVVLWIGGMSRAGLLGGAVAVLVLVVLAFRTCLRHWKTSLGVLAMSVAILVSMNLLSEGAVMREFASTLPSALASRFVTPEATPAKSVVTDAAIQAEAPQPEATSAGKPLVLTAVLEGNVFRYETETEGMRIVFETDAFVVQDLQGNPIPHAMSATPAADGSGSVINTITFNDPKYKDYRMQPINNGILLMWHDVRLPLVVVDGTLRIAARDNTFIAAVDEPATFGFKGREFFANSRGYIWSRSIPMVRDTLLIGHGPDTYAAYFPQFEIAAKINYLNSHNLLVDKPHNWYIQLAVNTGLLSLIVVVVLLGGYLLRGFLIRNELDAGEDRLLHIGILCGIVGYGIAAVFNDSNVSVSPVFWVLLGSGLSYLEARRVKRPRAAKA